MMSTNKLRILCRFGGDLVWESNKVYYKGGKNRIVHVDRAINYLDLLAIVRGICKSTDISSIEYKYPGLDLDSLVSIENDNDVSNMIEAFPQSNEPVQLFVFCAQNLSIPTVLPSNLLQNANNENNPASLQELHESNEILTPSSHNNNDVPRASDDLRGMDGLLMENKESPCKVVVDDEPIMTSVLKEGQEFADANAFHKALREYSIRSNFEYKRTRSGGGRFQAKCIKDECSWRIHACKFPDKPTYKIKSLKGNHTCKATNESTISNTTTHRQATRRWIADLVKDRLLKNLECTPKDIVNEIGREYGIKVSYDKAWRGKELALKEIHSGQPDPAWRGKELALKEIHSGQPDPAWRGKELALKEMHSGQPDPAWRGKELALKEIHSGQPDPAWRGKELALKEIHSGQSDAALRMLCKDIETTNPGSTAKLSRSSENSLRVFVAYKATICGFQKACRPLLILDYVKIEGKCPGAWLFAMAPDAENEGFPVSFAFVETKNVESWKWFCSELAQVLGCIPKLTLESDRQEQILEVVSGIFPYASHRFSWKKLRAEILQKFNSRDCMSLLEIAANYKLVHSKFDALMCQIHDKSEEVWNFVKDIINPKYWAISHFEEELDPLRAYYHLHHMDSWRDKLEIWKHLPITSVLVHFHHYMTEMFKERFKNSLNWNTILVPRVENYIPSLQTLSERYSVSRNAAVFEVRYGNGTDAEKVDLERRTCSCNVWQVYGRPCPHVVAAIRYSGCNVYDYYEVNYTVAKYRETYSEVIHPLHLHNTSLSPLKKRKYEDFDERCTLQSILPNKDIDDDDGVEEKSVLDLIQAHLLSREL